MPTNNKLYIFNAVSMEKPTIRVFLPVRKVYPYVWDAKESWICDHQLCKKSNCSGDIATLPKTLPSSAHGDNEKPGAYPTSENYLFSSRERLLRRNIFLIFTFLEQKILLNTEKTIEASHFKNAIKLRPYRAFPKNTFIVWNFAWKIPLNLSFLERSHYNAYRGNEALLFAKWLKL